MHQTAYRAQASQYRLWLRQHAPIGRECKPAARPLPKAERCDPPTGYQEAWQRGSEAFRLNLTQQRRADTHRRIRVLLDSLARRQAEAASLREIDYPEHAWPIHLRRMNDSARYTADTVAALKAAYTNLYPTPKLPKDRA